jgi:hypothetical protein
MRYFLSLTRTEPALTGGVGQATPVRRTVTQPGTSQRRRPGSFSATARSRGSPGRTVDRQRPGNDSRHSGTDGHWVSSAQPADERWIMTTPGAKLRWLCESTVGGVASALTVKSWLALRLSPRPACRTNFQILCHLIRVTARRSNLLPAHRVVNADFSAGVRLQYSRGK